MDGERLNAVRSKVHGHRHDETVTIGLLLEVLDILGDAMSEVDTLRSDVVTLLKDVSDRLQALETKVGEGAADVAGVAEVDVTVKDAITQFEGTGSSTSETPGAGSGDPGAGGTSTGTSEGGGTSTADPGAGGTATDAGGASAGE